MISEIKFDSRGLHGGLYVVREQSISETLLRPPRRLALGEHALTVDRNQANSRPKLIFRVNPDWSITVDTGLSRRGRGTVSFPTLRSSRMENFAFGEESPFVDVTLKAIEDKTLAVIESIDSPHLVRARIVFVAPK